MKLRIRDDSVRLRLGQGEVRQLGDSGRVEAMCRIAPGAAGRLLYTIVADSAATQLHASWRDACLTIHVPVAQCRAWVDTDAVAMQADQDVDGARLQLLIEKDYQCLAPREGEDDADGFPHPKADSGASC